MAQKRLVLCLAALLVTTALPWRTAAARDLVKLTAALVLAQADEEPPPTRSQILEKQRQEEAARLAAEPKKVEDDAPYYKKWWFWALTAAVVGGTVALGVWAVDTTTKPAKACDPAAVACFGAGREGAR